MSGRQRLGPASSAWACRIAAACFAALAAGAIALPGRSETAGGPDAAVAAAPPPAASPPAASPAAASRAVRSGVTTHFSQGWPLRLMDDAARLGAVTIRDSVHWAAAEREPGRYAFTAANAGHVDRACAAGMTVLLGLEPRNPLYDGGQTALTPTAQAAFARYVRAVADRWDGCVIAVEIGNEINGPGGMTGPAAAARVAAHVALLRAVNQAVKPAHPRLALLGGSVNTVATGFLSRLFAAGALEWVDGIAVHPYRPDPDGLDDELLRVRRAMQRTGRVRPIWATEFSREFPDPAAAPGYYLKSAVLMESIGVTSHFWYALADQPGFPTMGLTRFDGTAKAVARAFAYAARELAPLGPAQRVDHGDPTLQHFRYGTNTHVVWGAPRPLAAAPGARAWAADGTPIAVPAAVTDAPVIIRGPATLAFGPAEVLADSHFGHGKPPLAWFAQDAGDALHPLAPVDWDWTTYLGTSGLPQFAVNPGGIGTLPGTGTVVRYTHSAAGAKAPAADHVIAQVCLRRTAPSARAGAALRLGGRTLWQAAAGQTEVLTAQVPAVLGPGDRLDLVLSPAAHSPPARFRYRLRIARPGAEPIAC